MDYLERARSFFEPQLKAMGLGQASIEVQSLPQLRDSLLGISDAISHPSQFGQLGLKFTAKAGVIIAQATDTEAVVTIGALPILLERKRQILERIRLLAPEEHLEGVRAVVTEKVEDPAARDQLFEILSEYANEQRKLTEEVEEVERAEVDAAMRDIEIRERKWQMRRSLLEREPVAIVIGAVLLIVLTLALVLAMFTKIAVPEIFSTAFLLILGFFFGQTTASTRGTRTSSPVETAAGPRPYDQGEERYSTDVTSQVGRIRVL
jgi:hypothetical protein